MGINAYAHLFKTGQYGRFYVCSHRYSEGHCLRIQLLPKNEKAIGNGDNNLCTNNDAVLVYGIVNNTNISNREYGWLHNGPWIKDFEKLVDEKQSIEEERIKRIEESKKEKDLKEQERIKNLLSNY